MEDLIIRYLRGTATPEEEAKLRAWREASRENGVMYAGVAKVLASLRETEVDSEAPQPAAIVARAEAPDIVPLRTPTSRKSPARRVALAIAASIAFVLLAGEYIRRDLFPGGSRLEAVELVTGGAETAMTQLSDGTIVHLAENSRLRIRPVPGRREVWLEGRAFFGVAEHGSDWPFVVQSSGGQAQVLGTRFEFSTAADRVRVVVVEGRVSVSSAGESVEVAAGQMSIASADASPIVDDVEDVEQILGWMGRTLVFHDTPLTQAVTEIEARYGGDIEIEDEELARETISGGFNDMSFTEIVSTVCRAMMAECAIQDQQAVIGTASR